jgi:NitT/TauT family transport system ATP-binding protein
MPKRGTTEPGGSIAIDVRGVTQRYGSHGGAGTVLAVDDVSLQIRAGEFVSLLGPSGCGKSTLLNIIGGLFPASAGSVLVGGEPVRGQPLPRHISFVFQESTLFPWYTVLENFRVGFKFQGIPRAEWDDRAMAALTSVGMHGFARHYPSQLSVGMRQRINMARGIASETSILLMDEPFAALDEQTRMVLGEDLSTLLAATGKTILFVTHSLAEAVYLSDRIVVMTARPARIKRIIEVNEPHPRRPGFMLEPRFNELRTECYALLRDEIRQAMRADTSPGG